MPNQRKVDLLGHPAVQAWSQLGPGRVEPERIEVLKRRETGVVYRLVEVGIGQSDIIAKRCQQAKANMERLVYEKVFPHLPLATLHFYGFVEEEDGQYWWLFLEDVGNQPYLPSVAEHRTLATRWLGIMHTVVENLDLETHLPSRGPDNYLTYLRSIPEALPQIRAIRSLDNDEWTVLEDILSMCEFLDLNWDQVETFCDGIPRTLIHGDCLAKNIHVRATPVGLGVVLFDWGGAGWGLPAADLGLLGLPHHGRLSNHRDYMTYLQIIQGQWPSLNVQKIQRLEKLGQMFWALKIISLEVNKFDYPWAETEHTLNNFRIYGSVLADSMRSGGWNT